MSSLFISDLHLSRDTPHISSQACELLQHLAPDYQHLYILGDLVEYWLGDDAYDGSFNSVFDAIRALSKAKVKVFIMPGNRDFLLGPQIADHLNARLVGADEYTIEDESHSVLLLHGDTLCTEDAAYQQLRGILRNADWQKEFLSKPVSERLAEAAKLRDTSRKETLEKSSEIMDVSQDAVEAAMLRHGVRIMIHGHTHRPAEHCFQLQGQPAKRLVLGDWSNAGAYIATLENHELNLRFWPAP